MKSLEKFYDQRHAEDHTYSAGAYAMHRLYTLRALNAWMKSRQGHPLRMLDVGCGKGLFLGEFIRTIKSRWELEPTRVIGLDLVRSPGDLFAQISPPLEFVQTDIDGNKLPIPDASVDFLSCNHVLEHVFETEKLVREFRRVLAPDGLAIVSVPNIAAWINRVGMLWGNQPLGSEVGTERTTYGFRPAFLQAKLAKFQPSGHIRDFTPRGLQDVAAACGFETVGWWKQSRGFIASLGKWAGREMGILLKPVVR